MQARSRHNLHFWLYYCLESVFIRAYAKHARTVLVTVGASFFFAASGGGVQWGVAAAVVLVASVPQVVLGTVMDRQITRSLLVGAVKG